MGMKYLVGIVLLLGTQTGEESANAQTTSAIATGAVELRLSATGQSISRADVVTINVPIVTNAETALAARSANRGAITNLTNALVSRGIDRSSITLAPATSQFGFISNPVEYSESPPVPAGIAAMMARKTANSTLQIRLSDPSLVDRVREALDEQNQAMGGIPLYSLRDDRVAKNAAISDALTKAKQDAETYAASLGLRVERITSVSNYGDTPIPADPDYIMRMLAGAQGRSTEDASTVITDVRVWVNFVLVPR